MSKLTIPFKLLKAAAVVGRKIAVTVTVCPPAGSSDEGLALVITIGNVHGANYITSLLLSKRLKVCPGPSK